MRPLFFLLLFGSLTVYAGSSSPQELARDLLDLEVPELCAAYRAPLDSLGLPRPPFVEAPSLAAKRREQSAAFRESLAAYLAPLPLVLLDELAALGRRALGGGEPPVVVGLDQARLCADGARARVDAEAPNSPPVAREQMRLALEADCMEESYGRANAYANEIVLGLPVAQHRNRESVAFAYLHEVCHVKYPAIRHTFFEEIFCDAVAAQWFRQYRNFDNLPSAVEEILLPKNPFREILVLRARLPALCL